MSEHEIMNYGEMTNADLVSEFNRMVEHPLVKALNHRRYQIINKFTDQATGAKRCELLASTIRTLEQNERRTAKEGEVEDTPTQQDQATQPAQEAQQKVSRNKAKTKQAAATATRRKRSDAGVKRDPSVPRSNGSNPNHTGWMKDFKVRADSKRERVLVLLVKNINKPVGIKKILDAAYQSDNMDFHGPIKMLFKGITDAIDKHGLKLEFKRDGKGEGASYGLFETD